MFALMSMGPVAVHKEVIVMTDNIQLFHLGMWQSIMHGQNDLDYGFVTLKAKAT